MPHGRPDYNATAGYKTTYRWSDLDELAARLGSPVTYDRRGDVLFIESFEKGDGMITWATAGAGSTAGLSLQRARTGQFSACLYTPAVVNPYARLTRRGTYPVASALGVEISFTHDFDFDNLELEVQVLDGAYLNDPFIRYSQTLQALQYRDAALNWVTIAGPLMLNANDMMFHTLKLVLDLTTNTYVRVLLNNLSYSLAGIPYRRLAAAVAAEARIIFTAYGAGANWARSYVDDIIFTQNEPP